MYISKFIKKTIFFLCTATLLFAANAHASIPKVQEYKSPKGIKIWAIEDSSAGVLVEISRDAGKILAVTSSSKVGLVLLRSR